MKTRFTKILCTLCAAAMLLLPMAALAEGETPTLKLCAGLDPGAFVTVPVSGLDKDDLYLNEVKYKTHTNNNGDLVVLTDDLELAVMMDNIKQNSLADDASFYVDIDADITIDTPIIIENGALYFKQSTFTKADAAKLIKEWIEERINNVMDVPLSGTKPETSHGELPIIPADRETLLKGKNVVLSDGAGKALNLEIATVWTKPVVVETKDNDRGDAERTVEVLDVVMSETAALDGNTIYYYQNVPLEVDPMLMVTEDTRPDGATKYRWKANLPAGLAITPDITNNAHARIIGDPHAVTSPEGTPVTVNVTTNVGGQDYVGSYDFTIVVGTPQ